MLSNKKLLKDMTFMLDNMVELFDELDERTNDLNNALNDLFTFLEVSRINVDENTGIGKVVSIRRGRGRPRKEVK